MGIQTPNNADTLWCVISWSYLLTAALGPYDFVADVIFMLDSSSRVTPQDYMKEKEFVKLIARYLNITPGKSRGSVIVFSTDANPLLPFDGYSSMSGFNTVIDKAPQLSGKRRIDRAFGAAATLFQNARPSVRKVYVPIFIATSLGQWHITCTPWFLFRYFILTTKRWRRSNGLRSHLPLARCKQLCVEICAVW